MAGLEEILGVPGAALDLHGHTPAQPLGRGKQLLLLLFSGGTQRETPPKAREHEDTLAMSLGDARSMEGNRLERNEQFFRVVTVLGLPGT